MSKTFYLSHESCEGHDVWEFEDTEEGCAATVRCYESINPYRRIVMDGDSNVLVYRYETMVGWKLEAEFDHGIVFDLIPFMLLAHRVKGNLLGKCTVVEAEPEVLYG